VHDGGSFSKDARLTPFDVLLVRDDVEVSNHDARNYSVFLQPPIAPLEVKRGYVMVEASVADRAYRVINTHLEAAVPQIRNAQAAELMAYLVTGDAPTILLGDFNSAPDIEADIDDHDTYLAVTGAGFVDMWKGGPGTGFTCCQGADLTAAGSLSKRIDFVFVRNSSALGAASIDTGEDDDFTVGDQPLDRVPNPEGTLIWPSDHAGVGAVLYVD
jgi:endonuclease/exonuclease/phosphatase family metal-dependent hydrolase